MASAPGYGCSTRSRGARRRVRMARIIETAPRAGWRIGLAFSTVAMCAACDRQVAAPAAPPRPVRTVTVEPFRAPPSVGFVGRIEARDDASLGFRISGRMTDRLVGVGAELRGGQVVAQLHPQNELNALRSARAALA